MAARDDVEFRELRATIRERGTARIWVFVIGTIGWASIAVAAASLSSTPLATLLPLFVLATVFEAVYALHVGAERIGRYLQVFHEADAADSASCSNAQWEHAAMVFGRPAGAPRTDPLFAVCFVVAAVLNLAPAFVLQPIAQEVIFIGGAHALFALRVFSARQAAAKQRSLDLSRFQQIKRNSP